MVEKDLKSLARKRGQVSLQTGFYGRLSLTRDGLVSLVNRYGFQVNSRMTKLDIWTMFCEVPVGRTFAFEVLEILERKEDAAWDRKNMVVEMGFRPTEDDDGLNTGIGNVPPSWVYPVARLDGLEQVLYAYDPRNEVTVMDPEEYYRLKELESAIMNPWVPYAKYRTLVKMMLRESYQLAKAADQAKRVATRTKRDDIQEMWDYKWRPSRYSPEFAEMSEEREFNGRTLVETPVDKLVNGYDVFISSRGADDGWALNRRGTDGSYRTWIPLRPTKLWLSNCRVSRDMQEHVLFNRKPGAFAKRFKQRLDSMLEVLKASFTGPTGIINDEGFRASRKNLEDHVNAEMRHRIVKAMVHPQKEYSDWNERFLHHSSELKVARKAAEVERETGDEWETFWNLKAELALAWHRSQEAWTTFVDQEALDDVRYQLACLPRETTSGIWQEDKWLTNSPDNSSGNDTAQIPMTWDLLAFQEDKLAGAEVRVAYSETFTRPRCDNMEERAGKPCKCPSCRPQPGLTTNESLETAREMERTLNENQGLWHFVDPAVIKKSYKAHLDGLAQAAEKRMLEHHGNQGLPPEAYDSLIGFDEEDFCFSDQEDLQEGLDLTELFVS